MGDDSGNISGFSSLHVLKLQSLRDIYLFLLLIEVVMWFMFIVGWLALILQIIIITLSIAAGLYYLAELVEEYTVLTAKIIRYLLIFTSVVYAGLYLFEEFPLLITVSGLTGNVAFYFVLQTFPYFVLSSPSFIASIVFVVINHYLAFQYFATVWYQFSDVLAFFTICLWLVPFAFFVSLSANENVLPTMAEGPLKENADVVSNYFNKKGKKYGLLSFFKMAQENILPERVRKHY